MSQMSSYEPRIIGIIGLGCVGIPLEVVRQNWTAC